ncbi:MAG: hypothetical protein CL678_15645 [Bdellovibrionaceae bacterium]|nr:hypothetical protein [Pseudobdellovibrionaceae bacterium]
MNQFTNPTSERPSAYQICYAFMACLEDKLSTDRSTENLRQLLRGMGIPHSNRNDAFGLKIRYEADIMGSCNTTYVKVGGLLMAVVENFDAMGGDHTNCVAMTVPIGWINPQTNVSLPYLGNIPLDVLYGTLWEIVRKGMWLSV